MKYIVYLDDGHGTDTPGKRTPNFQNGTFMHEQEFNQAVRDKLMVLLTDYDIEVVPTTFDDKDISLKRRVEIANKHFVKAKKAYEKSVAIFISIHANAITGRWQTAWKGVEVFHARKTLFGNKLATILLEELMKGTPQKNRGVKAKDFYVLRETYMTAALVECGFMDNLEEAQLLKSDRFRQETAENLLDGILRYFDIAKKQDKVIAEINIDDRPNVIIRDNVSYVKIRHLKEILFKQLGITVVFNPETRDIEFIKGRE